MPAVYSEMDLMLGQMMHSTIFATGACIPTVAIGYDIKLKNFLSLMGLDEYLLNITDWSEGDVLGLLEKAHTNSTNIRCAIAKRKAELATNELTFLAALPQTLEAAA
jgi:colanic acid/amylovoran biosynthesis protein